jgi:ribosomal protein S18 acetylase RimI-like enzyme
LIKKKSCKSKRLIDDMDDPVLLSQIIVRLARSEDLPALEWDGEYIHFRRLYADVYQNYVAGKALMWIVEHLGDGIIGQAFVSLESFRPELANGNDRAYLYGFRVKPVFRNRGVGRAVLEVIEKELVKRGYRIITLNVARNNFDAERLYRRLGYRIVAEEAGQWSYFDHLGMHRVVHEPAWRMEKVLKNI